MSTGMAPMSALGVFLNEEDSKLADAEAVKIIKDVYGGVVDQSKTLTELASELELNDELYAFDDLIGLNPTFQALAVKYGGPHVEAIFAKVDYDGEDEDIGGEGVSFRLGCWIYAIPRENVPILRKCKGREVINLSQAVPEDWDWIDWFGVC